ncbi:efflux RND transporter periplasmic adaptor subunit [Cohnella silvisoli]|uniref:Efflux RND transporter periplasmic adaptor subunit n=1 Tax=Cohnella silvisoli TaxID=2873699 RepID=A0ABV1KYE6_9BACL|nr:efflux RND transporter periplasmic adaptor subunit [Cohnella silvisoli]MCD9021798.1 efflux RND transporter periplasmic adaptor subunit [Cohnella silvisoli]
MSRKKWWIVGLAVVLAAGSWGGYRYFKKDDKQLAASYVTTQVRKGTLEVKISGTGSIQPSARATLKASTVGTALKVNFKQGDTVKKGDVLISYEEEDVSDQVSSKEIDVKKKKLELTDLQTKYKEAADDAARESLMLSIQKQQLDIEMAQQDISSLKTSKSIDPIVAPIDGILSTFDVHAGDSLNPNGELGEIVNFSQLQMVVGVDELDIPKVKLAQESQILVEALPNETFTGKVVAIADEGTTNNGVASFDVTIQLAETKNLKVGMSAEASIMTDKKTDALYVPVEAVQSFQGKYFVMVPSTGTGTSAGGGTNAAAQAAEGNAAASPQSGQGGQAAQGQTGQGTQGQTGQNRNSSRFQNMTDEERAAMREQFAANRGTGGANASTGTGTNTAATTTRVAVEVGINNEDSIEILSGVKEGDAVVLPTVVSSSSKSNAQTGGFPGLGGAGIPGGGGGFAGGGGFSGRQSTGGGSGSTGGGR